MRSLLAACALAIGACAHDLVVRYPYPDAAPGSLTFVLTQPATDVTIAVDGTLVVDDEHTGRVHIDNVPSGSVDVVVAVGPEEKAMKLWIEPGKDVTVPLGSAGASMLTGWSSALVSLAGVALYALIRR